MPEVGVVEGLVPVIASVGHGGVPGSTVVSSDSNVGNTVEGPLMSQGIGRDGRSKKHAHIR